MLLAFAGPPTVTAEISTEDEAARIGYSIGQQIGRDYQRQGVGLDAEALSQGLRDGLAGHEPRLDPNEIETILQKLKQGINDTARAQAQEEHRHEQERHKSDGEAFLAANQQREGVVTTRSGLQYKVLRAGTGPRPTATDTVTVNYRGTRLNGDEFDSSDRSGRAATFAVDEVLPGWTEALQLMPVGAKWEVYLPWNLAFGARGPLAYQTVIFQIELLDIGEEPSPQGAP